MNPKDLTKIFTDLFKSMKLDIAAEVTADDALFLVNLTGKDVRYIDGGKDNKIGSIVTLVKLIAKKQFSEEPRIVVDVNNQRKQRLENVAQMAKKTAEMVRVRGGEEELRPMSPAERRAVHMALKEMQGIKTESRGEEPHRRIVIIQEATD